MKSRFPNSVSIAFILLFVVSLLSCDTNKVSNNTVASDSSTSFVAKQDTAMPKEPVTAAVAPTDSLTPNVRYSPKDSIGSKISIHQGKVKVVDTTRNDK